MKLDPEAGIEGPGHHPFAMNLKDSGICKPAHQSLTHPRRIGAGLGGEQQRFGHRLDCKRHDDLIGNFRGLPVAGFADQGDVLPINSRTGFTRSKAAWAPPTMMESVAFRAPTSPPETGASSHSQPFWAKRLANFFVAIGLIELMSMRILAGLKPSAMPLGPNTTASDIRRIGTIVMTASERSATSRGDPQGMAPASIRSDGGCPGCRCGADNRPG